MKACIYDKKTGQIKAWIDALPADVANQETDEFLFAVGVPAGSTHINLDTFEPFTKKHVVYISKDTTLLDLRFTRDKLLTKSDWTQMPDVPLTPDQKQLWADYRQALRDFPDTCTDLANPIWPTPPY